jgi:hypothetical protein
MSQILSYQKVAMLHKGKLCRARLGVWVKYEKHTEWAAEL